MRNHTMTKLALACGALMALGLTGCNREREQMDTEPAAASTAAMTPAMTEPAPMATMPSPAPASTATMPTSPTTMPGATGEATMPAPTGTAMTDPTMQSDAAGAPPTR